MPVAASYARVGPTTFPYAIAAVLLRCSRSGTAVAALRGGFPEREQQNGRRRCSGSSAGWRADAAAEARRLLDRHRAAVRLHRARLRARAALADDPGRHRLLACVIWIIFARRLQLSLPAGPLERLIL